MKRAVKRKTVSLKETIQLCEYWQKIMRLQDWDIDIKLLGAWEMEGRYGTCRAFLDRRKARIELTRIEDYPPDHDGDKFEEYEKTLIHELGHVFFAPLQLDYDKPEEKLLEEQMVYSLEHALYALSQETA